MSSEVLAARLLSNETIRLFLRELRKTDLVMVYVSSAGQA
jgi:hypothetical protein